MATLANAGKNWSMGVSVPGVQAAVSSKVGARPVLALGIEAVDKSGPADMAKVMEAARVRLGDLIKAANIKAD